MRGPSHFDPMPAPPSALLIESAIAKPTMAEISEETRADVALIDRVVARDPAAIAELYDRHSRLLFGLVLRIVKERGEAEDVLQDVFLSAWTRAGTYKPALGSPVAWLVGIARNRAIDRLRANGVRLTCRRGRAAPARRRTVPSRRSCARSGSGT